MPSDLPQPGSPEHGWVLARWAAVSRRLEDVPARWADWAVAQLTADVVGRALPRTAGPVPAGETPGYDAVRSPPDRVALGQVFTPRLLAELVADVSGAGRDEATWPDPTVLDPACGAGSLLLATARRRAAAGWPRARVLGATAGWDRDPVAAWSCRAALVEWALQQPEGDVPPPLRVQGGVDALALEGVPGALARREAPWTHGVGAVVSNPPYLEAKRMGRVAPGLKERLRERFPQLQGAFDLYLAFCWQSLVWAGEGGSITLLLPNKVLQGRYARRFRARILDPDPPGLGHLVDLSRLRPRPFPGTGVYPIVLQLDQRGSSVGTSFRAHRVQRVGDLDVGRARWTEVALDPLRRVGGEQPLFVPFSRTWGDLEPLLSLDRLGQVAALLSTCSFHKRGLRERFVTPERPHLFAHPYLGGRSRARRTEIGCFRLRWDGWWISYEQERLKREHGNPLPPLKRTFLRPKAIFCQHAVRMRAWADRDGRFVTKDVYPVAWPTDPRWTLGRLVAVLSSTVFTALYNTLFQGIVVGGETYHYLPAFLKLVPVPAGDHPALADADARVDALQAGDGEVDAEAWRALDRRVAEAYGVDEAARRRMVEVHLERVGAASPG